ncbi:repetitive organellar protein-like [Leptopilina boulardi]|uniref:repetitive organellar protein-like n=1 Tax=Leptopilina boulardi TaxID=63433 RepID=UPI0021F520A5|nr:repetitive organellar protein-like [Leptopilina boulardi]XP_051156537.1 repetitive organellar protein-like [Leptopilina boulardi]
MNQENSSEITVEGKETNPAEGETCQDEKNEGEETVNNAPIVENENQVNENQVNENENQDKENENQVNENENQVNNSENEVKENQVNESENQVKENENQVNEIDENEKQCSTTESEKPLEEIHGEESVAEQNVELNKEPNSNTESVLEEKSDLNVNSNDTNLKIEKVDTNVDAEIQGTNSSAENSLTQNPKDKVARNQKRGHKNSKAVNCDKYGWPIGSKYCTEVNDSSNEVNFAEDVDLASCETKVNIDNKTSQEPDEEILYVVKSPSHRTANTKRTIVKVEEVEGAITDGIHAGTHVPHFLNYLSLQVKFKFTLARLPDGKLKITFRFVGKGGESLKDIICLWLRRNDEDKDKIFCETLTRNKEVTLSILAQKFHEQENLKEDIVTLYEEIKKLIPEYRGKEGLRSEDEAFLKAYRNLDNKLLILIMLLFKDNCESKRDSKFLSKFRDLYFSLQIRPGFTVKQYLHVIYCYNMIFTPYLPQELEEMVKNYAIMKNITLPDSPPLIIPPCGQKTKLTVINPFAKKKLQNTKQEDNRAKENTYAEYEMVSVKTDDTKPEQLTENAKKNVSKKRQTYRRNRRPYYKKNNNPSNTKIQQGQRTNQQNSSNPRNNLRNQFNNNSRNRQNLQNQKDNSLRSRNPTVQRNPSNKRQQRNQGGPPAKKRIVNQNNSVDRDTLSNPVSSVDQGIQENFSSSRNQQQNKRTRPRTRPRRKNISNQQNNDNSRNNQQQNSRINIQNQRNNLNSRNNLNQRNNTQNQRNNIQNQRNNQNSRNEKNNSTNERNHQQRRSRRRSDIRKRNNMNSDHYFGMSDMSSRNQGFSSTSSSSNNHEFLLNSLRNQNLMQSNMRNHDMGRNQNFTNDRNSMFSQSNSRNQNFSQDNNSPRHNNFPSQSNQQQPPRSLFAQRYFDMPRNQNFSNTPPPPPQSRRSVWSSDFAGSSQNYFPGSNNFSNRSNNSMNRNLGDNMSFSNYNNSRMSFDDDMHTHNFMNSNNQNWDNNDFNRGKRKNMRDDWNSKRSKRGI